MFITGVYLDGKTSKRHKVRLLAVDKSAQIRFVKEGTREPDSASTDDETLFSLPFSQLKISSALGNTPREFSFGEDQLFITEDHKGVAQLIAIFSGDKSASILHKLETNLSLVMVFILAVMAIVWGTFVYAIPKAADLIAQQLPEFVTEHSTSSLQLLDASLFEPSQLDLPRRQHIELLVQPYLNSYARLTPKLLFRSGIGANAMALPAGEIVFTDELVELTKSDDELLAVFFHEIGHLQHKHMLRRILQGSMVTLALIFISGDVDSLDLMTGLPTLLVDLSYSREFEKEADSYALDQLHHFNLSLDSFALIMQRLESEKEKSSDSRHSKIDFFSSHPATEQRIKFIEQYKEELKTVGK